MFDFLFHHWYDLGILAGLAAIQYYRVNQASLSTTHKLLLANFVAITIHQFEEYRFPGGFPAAMNIGVHHSTSPERVPLSAYSSFLTNVVATYGFYLPPLFYPDIVWLGLGPFILGFSQLLIHGVNINMKMGAFYNPGLVSVLVLFIPLGYLYLRHTSEIGVLTRGQLLMGLVYGVSFGYLVIAKSTFGWLVDENSPYPFTQSEMERGGVMTWLAAKRA